MATTTTVTYTQNNIEGFVKALREAIPDGKFSRCRCSESHVTIRTPQDEFHEVKKGQTVTITNGNIVVC